MPYFWRQLKGIWLYLACFVWAIGASAANTPSIQGTVTDPSGAVVIDAKVELLQNGIVVTSSTTNAEGRYELALPRSGDSYQLRVSAPAFQEFLTAPIHPDNQVSPIEDVKLKLDTLAQQVTITATGTPTTQAQLGAAVTVLTQSDFSHTRDAQEVLRLVPGVQVTQTGQAGGTTALSIRGGNGDANKVLIDGIPVNDIGGAVQFATIASTGIAKAEILRGPNSALYGSDALAGVVSLTSVRGTTPSPQLTYLVEGGNFGTYHQEGTLGGTWKRFDYFSDYSRFDTSNDIPRNQFHNGTFVGNFGWNITPNSSLRATIHHEQVASGQPNAVELYGIPDDTEQKNEDAYIGVTYDNQTTDRWHNLLRYGAIRLRSQFTDFAPTGIPQYDPSGDLLGYLGTPITIRGANGYTVSGQAFYQFAEAYPNFFPTSTDRDFVYAQSSYTFSPHLIGLFGFNYEDERGYSDTPDGSVERGNYSYTLQLQGALWDRLYYTIGSGIEKNELFGVVPTPRASIAWDLFQSTGSRFLGHTKLRASFGKGIKEPNIVDQTTSLFALLASLPNGPQLISQYGIRDIGAENSRTYDGGVDQELFHGRGRVSITYFHNEFTNGIEYIPQQGLIDLGVPPAVADQALFGASVNSQAFRAQGLETEIENQITSHLFARGGYTYLDAVVQRSFSSDAIGPTFNPNFPSVPIGVDTPLVGARPFRQAPHSGYFGLAYSRSRLTAQLTGTLVSRRDDSDFLFADANGLPTLLLPNRNLDGAYQRLDLSASYRVNRSLSVFSSFQNLLNEHYSEAFGFPSLPFTFRSGMQFTLGGESWKLR